MILACSETRIELPRQAGISAQIRGALFDAAGARTTPYSIDRKIGKRIDISGPTYLRQIIGVVGDVKQAGLKAATSPQVYEPFAPKPSDSFNVVLRGSNVGPLSAAIREQVSALDKE
jgi:hypothetical protein